MVRISKEDKLLLKKLDKVYSMERIKKIRGLLLDEIPIDEAIRKTAT